MEDKMYLAPLNYDRFFKKVFSDKVIAQAFLEDFLNIKIIEIEILDRKKYITDNAIPVEFDYRCKLDSGESIIIEMQQWYKTDIIRRFYLYHSLSTSLQLETLEEKVIFVDNKTGTVTKDKLYNDLKPSVTLIWMVDDNLDFKENFITYQMGLKKLNDFVRNDDLWAKSFELLLKERKKILDLDNNNAKGLKFISQNKLIFIFQKNIVKNIRNSNKERYTRWFDFAFKTKNKENKKEDFKDFENDKLFSSIIHKLLKERLSDDDIKYISKEDDFKESYIEYTTELINAQKGAEKAKKEAEKAKKEVEKTCKETELLIKKNENEKKDMIINMLKINIPIKQISEISNLSIEEIKKLQENLK
jgi:hypothetical protein